jgi:hypothetical protein
MELRAEEFLRRFLLHIVPPHFVRIRPFGLLANRTRQAKLARCRHLLARTAAPARVALAPADSATLVAALAPASAALCPACGVGRLRVSEVLAPQREHPP